MLEKITPYEKERVEKVKERITDALEKTLNTDYDKNRLEQELIYYIEKLDVNEEKQRLTNHLKYFISTLESGNGQGKKLGFNRSGNGTGNQYAWQQVQPCRNAENRCANER